MRSTTARLRKLTGHNDWMAKELTLGTVKPVEFTNKDGVRIGALLTLPPGVTTASKLPFVLHIHGGPNGQDTYGFMFDREWIAANGYAVLQVNYRGSHGRGQDFQSAIFGDWGNKEVMDLLAGRGLGDQGRHRRSGAARHRRLELRRHPDQLHDRKRSALQGRGERRRQFAPADHVRHRPVHRPVRERDGPAVEDAWTAG